MGEDEDQCVLQVRQPDDERYWGNDNVYIVHEVVADTTSSTSQTTAMPHILDGPQPAEKQELGNSVGEDIAKKWTKSMKDNPLVRTSFKL